MPRSTMSYRVMLQNSLADIDFWMYNHPKEKLGSMYEHPIRTVAEDQCPVTAQDVMDVLNGFPGLLVEMYNGVCLHTIIQAIITEKLAMDIWEGSKKDATEEKA